MGRRNRPGRQRKARFVQSTNQKQSAYRKKKAKLKKRPTDNDDVKNAWDITKTVKQNMAAMGLTYDINDVKRKTKMTTRQTEIAASTSSEPMCIDDSDASTVCARLQRTAATAGRPASYHVSEPHMNFCVRMIEQYGDDYEAMTRDATNYYQETATQIKRKLVVFMKTPQYRGYLAAKASLA